MNRVVAAVLALGVMNIRAATYYVDTSGSDTHSASQAQNTATPWKTVSHGIGQLAAGDELQVRAGVYREQVTVGVDGNSGSPVVIRNYPGETPVIDGSMVLTGWQQCTAADEGLTVGGTVNPDYASIYWTEVDAADMPNLEKVWLNCNGRFLAPANDPDQSDPDILNLADFASVPDEGGNVGQDAYLVDTERFTQGADDYWAGAFCRLYMASLNGNTYTTVISGYDAAGGKITFQTPPDGDLGASDGYIIYNHPHTLDGPGEYCYTTTASDGKYKVYVWPESTGDLDGGIALSVRDYGVYMSGRQWVTVRGFEIRNAYSLGTYSYGCRNVGFVNCRVHSIDGKGMYDYRGKYNTFGGCRVSHIKGDDGFGIHMYRDTNVVMERDTVWQSEHSALYMSRCARSILSDCLVEHWDGGIHNNGITVYTDCKDILVARNRAVYLRTNTVSDIYVYNNIFLSTPNNDWPMAEWTAASSNIIAVNNTCVGQGTLRDTWFRAGSLPGLVTKNNIMRGLADENGGDIGYNLYTMYASTGQVFGDEGSVVLINGATQLFTDYAGGDYHLQAECAAVDAGTDISGYLPTALFPDFDFDVDIYGNPRLNGGAPDMGAAECTATGGIDGDVRAASGADIVPGLMRVPDAVRILGDGWAVYDASGAPVVLSGLADGGVFMARRTRTGDAVSFVVTK